jgi:hypothetical protein
MVYQKLHRTGRGRVERERRLKVESIYHAARISDAAHFRLGEER